MDVVVRRYIDFIIIIITYLYSTCITGSSFFGSSIPTFLFIFKMFFCSCLCYFLCNIASFAQRTFEIVQKSRSHEHGDIIISTRMCVYCARVSPKTSTYEVPRDVSRKLQLTLCAIMAS